MKTLSLLLFFSFIILNIQAQSMFNDPYRAVTSTDYTIELAIKYDDQLLSEMPWCKTKMYLGMQMYGDISLKILDDGERLSSVDTPTFQIAVKDSKTGTIRMLSNETYTKVRAEDIVKQCKEGEDIIIMTTDRKYFLPQNSIDLLDEC